MPRYSKFASSDTRILENQSTGFRDLRKAFNPIDVSWKVSKRDYSILIQGAHWGKLLIRHIVQLVRVKKLRVLYIQVRDFGKKFPDWTESEISLTGER